MPWIAPIVGYSDRLGYLRCSDCADETQRDHAIHGDSHFGADDICESCRTRFVHIPTSRYVQVAFGYSAPDLVRYKQAVE